MSPRSELRSSTATRVSHSKQQPRPSWPARGSALAEPLSMLLDNQVLTFFEWCRLNRISDRTGRRILNAPDGPPVVRLSPRRIGITVRANREWQASRERT